MFVAPAVFSRAVARARPPASVAAPGDTRRTLIISGCSSVRCAADSSTPVYARSVTSAQPWGAWNEKPGALSIGPPAGFAGSVDGEVGETVGVAASLAAGSAAALLAAPHANGAEATITAQPSQPPTARRRLVTMGEEYPPRPWADLRCACLLRCA